MTPHNSAPEGAFAKTVLMPGDPLRAKLIADSFLSDVSLVTSVRNMLGFTGKYKGVPVSVMGSGMGMPSIGIYSYELYKFYGVDNIIRIGSAGSYKPWLNVKDVALAKSAFSESSFAFVQNGCEEKTLYPNPIINDAILKKAEEMGIVFYTDPERESWQQLSERTGTDCVEMESFALFHNANYLKKNAACLLTISDSFVSHVEISAEERQNSFTEMLTLALETAISL